MNVNEIGKKNNFIIKYGPSVPDSGPSESALSSFGYIRSDICDVRNRYIKLGYHLNEASRLGYYAEFGFDSIFDFAYENFGLDKSTVSRCMSVSAAFSGDGVSNSLYLDDKYSNYSYSQLVEMCTLTADELKKVNSGMSVREIREYKKSLRCPSSSCCDVATDYVSTDNKLLTDSIKKFFTVYLKSICKESHHRLTKEYASYFVKKSMDSYSGYSCSDLKFNMRPGRIKFNGCPEISFARLFSFADELGVTFSESHDFIVYPPLVGDFDSDAFIESFFGFVRKFVTASAVNSYKAIVCNSSGKRFSWSSAGTTYVVQLSVLKDKDK